ncbi:GPP34 family phosphoprotein [Isoptericola sp. AK164]|uniref:GOLPH3/VPS74 family protein n=1 Tax=Isoptericola sp. AK164 TaxID=3024246 RepID=UPI002418AE3C|nr:GPP34 family phosphoprotein [Isoptericola sp. AK164]
MLIAEDLLLLTYDDAAGTPDAWVTNLDYRLGGALLLELALAGRVDVAGPGTTTAAGSAARAGTVVVVDPSPTGHPVLDGALAVVGHRARKPKNLVAPLSKGVRRSLLAGLAEQRVLRREEGRVLGIFPRTTWPAADSSHELALRAECEAVLLGSRQPRPETAGLLAVAQGTSLVKRLVPRERRREAEARAKQLVRSSWAHEAVKKAVDEINAAVMTAVIIPATVGSSGT